VGVFDEEKPESKLDSKDLEGIFDDEEKLTD
jgi:hypothetical protein